MLWFNHNKKGTGRTPREIEVEETVARHKQALKQSVAKNLKVTDNLSTTVKENGFTIKIAIAAGAKR